MTLRDLDALNIAGCTYIVVDATKPGYLTNPYVLVEGDRGISKERYGNCKVVGFNSERKGKIMVYVEVRE